MTFNNSMWIRRSLHTRTFWQNRIDWLIQTIITDNDGYLGSSQITYTCWCFLVIHDTMIWRPKKRWHLLRLVLKSPWLINSSNTIRRERQHVGYFLLRQITTYLSIEHEDYQPLPPSQTRYMDRHCTLRIFVARDLKYRHTKNSLVF